MSQKQTLRFRSLMQTALFALSMVLLAASSLLAIPALIQVSNLSAWGSVATGQSIGILAAVIINWGWVVTGPGSIASSPASDHRREVLTSLRLRGTVAIPVALTTCAISALIAPQTLYAVLGAASMMPIGLSLNWYFIGTMRPIALLLLETIPRAGASTAAAVLMESHHVTGTMGLLLMASGATLAPICSSAYLLGVLPKGPGHRYSLRQELAARSHAASASIVASASGAASILLVNFVAPTSLGTFALFEKPFRQMAAALSFVPDVLQGKYGNRRLPTQVLLIRRAAKFLLIAAVPATVMLWGVTTVLLSWLSRGMSTTDWAPPMVSALAYLAIADGVVTRAFMPALNLTSMVARLNTQFAVAAGAATALGAYFSGALGAFLGMLFVAAAKLAFSLSATAHATRSPGKARSNIQRMDT